MKPGRRRFLRLASFARIIAEETGKWAKVVRFSGAKAD